MKNVPTAADLVNLGLARVRYDLDSAGRKHLFHIISDEGHALMGAAMRENALEARAAGAADWVRPPSRVIPGLAESPWQNAPLPGETS